MQELTKSKLIILSVIGLAMAVYLAVFAPYSIDKSQDIVIKKLSGFSELVEKEAASLSAGEPVKVEFLKDKGGALAGAGKGMIKKSERLMNLRSFFINLFHRSTSRSHRKYLQVQYAAEV